MEGYFEINSYCELAGVNKDTAYHRYYRKTIDGFQTPDGHVFLYFKTEPIIEIPEGYVSIKEFSEKRNYSTTTIKCYIYSGRIDKDDVVIAHERNRFGKKYFINQNAEIFGSINVLRPSPDYLTIREWCERENALSSIQDIKNAVRYGKIDAIRKGYYNFIHKDKHFNPQEIYSDLSPDGYISLNKWCEREGVSRNAANNMIKANKLNIIRKSNYYIFVKEEEHYDGNKVKRKRSASGLEKSISSNRGETYIFN